MLVKTLLNKAKKCKNDADAVALGEALEKAFGDKGAISHLPTANPEAYLENSKAPHVHVEFNHIISGSYITSIVPEIRNKKLTIRVRTWRMEDGLGMYSKKPEPLENMEETLDCAPDETIESITECLAQLAKANHRLLVEEVGISQAAAQEAVDKCW